jgi:mannose-1-phosphate guanylyltransferase
MTFERTAGLNPSHSGCFPDGTIDRRKTSVIRHAFDSMVEPGFRPAAVTSVGGDHAISRLPRRAESSWAVVLAGGEGARLRPLVRRIHPDGRPKQYSVLMGSRSMLGHTLERVSLAVPADRTAVVVTRAHAAFFSRDVSLRHGSKVLVQPADRGTAAGVLLPVYWIASRDPLATVTVFPSDHFVRDRLAFMSHVGRLSAIAARHPNWIFLVGAPPDGPDTGYGWIEPGSPLETSENEGVRIVRGFREKPDAESAQACMDGGGLWNTFVMVARASALIKAGRRTLPGLHEQLTRAAAAFETASETDAIDRAYDSIPTSNFSEAILASSSSMLAVSTLPPLSWSDWGTPDRVIATLQNEGIAPPWLRQLAPHREPRDSGGSTYHQQLGVL